MAEGVWKDIYSQVFYHLSFLSEHSFYEKRSLQRGKKWGKKREKKEKTDENSGHYVIASSRPPKRRPLERRTLAPKTKNDLLAMKQILYDMGPLTLVHIRNIGASVRRSSGRQSGGRLLAMT